MIEDDLRDGSWDQRNANLHSRKYKGESLGGLQVILVRSSAQIYSKLQLLEFASSSSDENHLNKAWVWCGFFFSIHSPLCHLQTAPTDWSQSLFGISDVLAMIA